MTESNFDFSRKAVLKEAVGSLTGAGISQPRREAEELLAFALGIERWRLYLDRGRPLLSEQNHRFQELLELRCRRCPPDYIRGRTGFFNCDLITDSRALIPRPETELLVEKTLGEVNNSPATCPRILDLCCGAGPIAVALAAEQERLEICASDISASALALARQNAELNGCAARVEFRRGDLFGPWSDCFQGFNLIVTNPPYLSRKEIAEASPEVRLFEPRTALDGGKDGLEIIGTIIRRTPAFLRPGGAVFMEIGSSQGSAVRALIEGADGLEFSELIRDYSGLDRIVKAVKK